MSNEVNEAKQKAKHWQAIMLVSIIVEIFSLAFAVFMASAKPPSETLTYAWLVASVVFAGVFVFATCKRVAWSRRAWHDW